MKTYKNPQTLVALVLTESQVIMAGSSRRSVTLDGAGSEGTGSDAQ